MHKYLQQLILLGGLLLACGQLQAQATLSVQGTIQRSTGAAVDDGDYDITFRLYTAPTGGSPVWSETQSGIEIIGGVYSVTLGSVHPLNAPFDQTYYLGISVGPGVEHTPRTLLTSAPYALSLLGQDNKFPSTGLVKMSAVATGQEITTATAYSVATDDHVIFLDHTANQNVTLPAASAANAGRHLVLVNKEAVAKTLTSSSYLDITNATSTTVPANSVIELQSDGSVWRQTGGYVTPTAAAKAYVRASSSSFGSASGSQVTLTNCSEQIDIGNNFNASTGVFTAPRTGLYNVSGLMNAFLDSPATGSAPNLYAVAGVTCNGCGGYIGVGFATIPNGHASWFGTTYAGSFYMQAGQTFTLSWFQSSGRTIATNNTGSWIFIAEL